MPSISNDMLSSTLQVVKKEMVDDLYKATPLLDVMRRKGAVEKVNGGSFVQRALGLAEHGVITSLSSPSGLDPINMAVADPMRAAQYSWCDVAIPVVISHTDELSNKGPEAIVSVAEARMQSVMGTIKREFELQAIKGTSTSFAAMSTLNGGAGVTTGFFESEAFGSQTNTVGGVAKSSFTASWQNQVKDASSALSVGKIADLQNKCKYYSVNGKAPDMVIGSSLFIGAYKTLVQAREFYVKESDLDAGRLTLFIDGAEVLYDGNLPTTLTESGTPVLSAFFLNSRDLRLVIDKDADFKLGEFTNVTGYAARMALLTLRCQLVVDRLASQGILVNGEA